jgi:multicomponent Na+:H+ antiporter subunit B
MHHHVVLRIITLLSLPAILLFALYVQFHGDYGAGGGFQAGVIFAVAFILYALVFGLEPARKLLPPWLTRTGIGLGALLYAGVGLVGLFFERPFLDYDVLAPDRLNGQHVGIFLVELGVGITVASVMVTLFLAFAGREGDPSDEEW